MIRAELLERAAALRADRVPFVAATVVRVERPASAKPGDCALVLPDGELYGFVGGECAEATVRSQAAVQLSTGESVLLQITPGAGSPVVADGLVTVPNHCLSGGTIDVFLEVVTPPMLILIYGDTPIARSLADVGRAAGWEVRTGGSLADGPVAVVVASHGGDEVPVLHEALQAGVPYVGLVASRKRGAAIADSLQLNEERRERFHTPAGLDIGAHRPGEIAVSILAEIVAVVPESYTRSL